MRLLLCLAGHAGEVVGIDDLLNRVWSGVNVTPDSVYQAVATLRRQLGDDPKQPTYIATVPRLGYRMVAPVRPWADQSIAQNPCGDGCSGASPAPPSRLRASRRCGNLPGTRRCFRLPRQGRGQQSLSFARRCFGAAEIHRRLAVSRPDRAHEPGALCRWHDRGTDRQTQQNTGPSGSGSHGLFSFQRQTGSHRRYRQGVGCRLPARTGACASRAPGCGSPRA